MYKQYIKRVLDVTLSILVFPFLLPVLLIITALILLFDGRPVFYKQTRMGQNGKPYKIYKFRSMIVNADQTGPLHTEPGDKRVTKTGAKLRSFSLDELPQIFNVFWGHMSFIGPRPKIYRPYEELTEEERNITIVKPGITGLAQVNGRSNLTTERKSFFEVYYAEHCSFMMDFKILFKTVGKVIKRENINNELPIPLEGETGQYAEESVLR